MDDLGLLVYLVFGIIYLIARVLKKKKKADPSNEMPDPQQSGRTKPRKPSPFDELLKEFEREFDLGDEERPSEKTLEKRKPEPKVDQSYESTAPSSVNPYQKYATMEFKEGAESLEEKLASSPIRDSYQRADHYRIENKKKHPIINKLKQPGGLKDAIVFSEIINKKHF
ncbi:MAG TPA: hypothetical protein DDY13_10100 [Cytophagales bacterium]|jgi:hypothetical protein|nr:hypothetical protein [Cytophagales bacterium]